MQLLRDLREATTMLVLYAVTTERHTHLRSLADELGMTVQGASEYVRRMIDHGLLQRVDGEYRATKRGVELLFGRFLELRSFVDRASREMAFIVTTSALAGSPVRRGERVGLFMEDGLLVAYGHRDSPSTGIANEFAAKGEDLAVRNLEGIIALRPGRILLARAPPKDEGGAKAVRDAAKKIRAAPKDAVVATLDVAGVVVARKLGLRSDIRYGVLAGTVEAAQLGLDVVLLLPEERAAEAVQAIVAANAKTEDKIPYESVALG